MSDSVGSVYHYSLPVLKDQPKIDTNVKICETWVSWVHRLFDGVMSDDEQAKAHFPLVYLASKLINRPGLCLQGDSSFITPQS
jgi:hypothetical protein